MTQVKGKEELKPPPSISRSYVTCVLALGLNWASADDRKTMASGEKRFAPRQQCSSKEQENKPATANDIRRGLSPSFRWAIGSCYSELQHMRAKRMQPIVGANYYAEICQKRREWTDLRAAAESKVRATPGQ